MNLLITSNRTIFLLFICFICFYSNNNFISGVNGNLPKKIYNGNIVGIKNHPYQVSIQFQNHHTCGGAIISNHYILTAASCVLSDLHVIYGNIKILTGTNDLYFNNEDKFAKFYDVAYVIFHNDYNPYEAWQNDIALLKTVSKINFNMNTNDGVLADRSLSISLTISGWGINPFTHIMIRFLQNLKVHTFGHYHCNQKYFHLDYLKKYQHCLILQKSTRVTQGNGGSPVTGGQKIIIGIISALSWNLDDPVVYTSVHGYKNWIEEIKLEI